MLTIDRIPNFDREAIINYQRKLIQNQDLQGLPKPSSSYTAKYMICQINQKINQLINDTPYNLRWIGSQSHAYIQAYLYCILMLTVEEGNNQCFMKFKNSIYHISRKYLTNEQQKLLIEFFCLIEFSSDKFLFLKKYPLVQEIFINLFQEICKESNYVITQEKSLYQSTESRKENNLKIFHGPPKDYSLVQQSEESVDLTDQKIIGINQLIQSYTKFGNKFPFIEWGKSGNSSILFASSSGEKIYIILQKQYFFILQPLRTSMIPMMLKGTYQTQNINNVNRDQLDRLFSDTDISVSNQTNSQQSLFQKLNSVNQNMDNKNRQKFFLQDRSTQKLNTYNKTQQNDQRTEDQGRNMAQSDQTNAKLYQTMGASQSKKGLKFPIFKKKNQNQLENSIKNVGKINQKINKNINQKLQYIDLLESSFQENTDSNHKRKNSDQKQKEKNRDTRKKNASPLKPKYFPQKNINPKSIQQSQVKKKQLRQRNAKSPQFFMRSRQLSAQEKNITGVSPNKKLLKDQIIEKSPQKLKNRKKKQDSNHKYSIDKKFFSPPRLVYANKQTNTKKSLSKENKNKLNKLSDSKQLKKDIKKQIQADKIYLQRKEKISKKIHKNSDGNNPHNNIHIPAKFSPTKVTKSNVDKQTQKSNNNDLQWLPRNNTQAVGHDIQKAISLINSQISQSKNDMPLKLVQTLNKNSDQVLKRKIFDHVVNKYGGDGNITGNPKFDFKRNRSQDPKQAVQRSQQLLAKVPNIFKGKVSNNSDKILSSQCPQSPQSPQTDNGNYNININYVQD